MAFKFHQKKDGKPKGLSRVPAAPHGMKWTFDGKSWVLTCWDRKIGRARPLIRLREERDRVVAVGFGGEVRKRESEDVAEFKARTLAGAINVFNIVARAEERRAR